MYKKILYLLVCNFIVFVSSVALGSNLIINDILDEHIEQNGSVMEGRILELSKADKFIQVGDYTMTYNERIYKANEAGVYEIVESEHLSEGLDVVVSYHQDGLFGTYVADVVVIGGKVVAEGEGNDSSIENVTIEVEPRKDANIRFENGVYKN